MNEKNEAAEGGGSSVEEDVVVKFDSKAAQTAIVIGHCLIPSSRYEMIKNSQDKISSE